MADTGVQNVAPESYEGTIKTLIHTQRGAYQNLDYLPVFRASGLFYVIVDDERNTVVSFMNYWLAKNGNDTLGGMVTLRDSEGNRVARSYFPVKQTVYKIDARELLELSAESGDPTTEFEGTMEIEFYSAEDLKFAFPALLVFYETSQGVSCVHTNQRIFNNYEDLVKGSKFNRWQTGFDVHCRDGARPFIMLVNGERASENAEARLKFFDSAGKEMSCDVALGDMPAYGAQKLDLSKIPDVANFLGDEPGFVKADVDVADVYCRFACGIEYPDRFVAITHSYFDCNSTTDYYDEGEFGSDTYTCFVPVNLIPGIDTDIIFYPIQSPTTLRFAVQAFDGDGEQRAWIDCAEDFQTDGGRQFRLNPRSILSNSGVDVGEEMVCIHISSADGKIPARITFGLNYHVGDLPGTNISSSVLMASSHGAKSRSWLWGAAPYRNGGRNVAMISHISKIKEDRSTTDYTLTVYGRDGEVASTGGTVSNGTGVNVEIEPLLTESGYHAKHGEYLWYVVKSDNPSIVCNQIHISAENRIGGDHSF